MKSVLILNFCFLFCESVCVYNYVFYLKWYIKKKNTKQNTKIQLKKTVYEIVNLAQQKLTNKKENSRNTKNDTTFLQYFYNFVIFYFDL